MFIPVRLLEMNMCKIMYNLVMTGNVKKLFVVCIKDQRFYLELDLSCFTKYKEVENVLFFSF